MPLTIATALTRLNAQQQNVFVNSYGTMSAAQQLQRINEVLDIWATSESWRGVKSVISLTSASGIISLPADYLRLDKRIAVTAEGKCGFFDIKPKEYMFQTGGPGWYDPTENCWGVAVDLGDDASGIRRYQLDGDTSQLDALTYSALARKRYVYATATTALIIPDSFPALEMSLRAAAAQDVNDNALSQTLWSQAFDRLDSDLGQFESGNEPGVMQVDPMCSFGYVPNLV